MNWETKLDCLSGQLNSIISYIDTSSSPLYVDTTISTIKYLSDTQAVPLLYVKIKDASWVFFGKIHQAMIMWL